MTIVWVCVKCKTVRENEHLEGCPCTDMECSKCGEVTEHIQAIDE